MNLETFLIPDQKGIFNMLRKMYKGNSLTKRNKYILVRGEAQIMLLAHMDTVHIDKVKYICKSPDGKIIMSPQGIGGDDRCGIYALVNAYENSPIKPWLLFTCDEEIGALGASAFADDYSKGEIPKELDDIKIMVEIDRKGSKDAVYYNCDNPDFEEYITSKGFVTDFGSFSDISVIAPLMGVAAVNLSSGYYNAHTLHEYINREDVDNVIKKLVEIIEDVTKVDFPKYEYIEKSTFESDIWNWEYKNIYKEEDFIPTINDYGVYTISRKSK